MKNKWEKKKIGEILRLEYGKPLPMNRRNSEGKYPVYGSNGVMTFSNEFYYDQKSIIVGRKGSAGELTLTKPKFWPLDVTYFVVYNKDDYDLEFLYYLLSVQQLSKLAKGVKPGINRNDVYAIDVCVPPLSEQRRIVEKLDQAFEMIDDAINKTQKKIVELEELRQSFLDRELKEKKVGEDYE